MRVGSTNTRVMTFCWSAQNFYVNLFCLSFFKNISVFRSLFVSFNGSHPDVFSLTIPRVNLVKTQLIYCQLTWRHFSTQGIIIRPIFETCLRYIKWKCAFLGSKNVYNSKRTWVQIRLIFTILYIKMYSLKSAETGNAGRL